MPEIKPRSIWRLAAGFLCAVILLGSAVSCSAPLAGTPRGDGTVSAVPAGTGRVALVLSVQPAARMLMPADSLCVASYKVTFTPSSGTAVSFAPAAGASLEFTLAPGSWTVVVLAKNAAGLDLYGAEQTFDVTEGAQTSLPLKLASLQGNALLDVDVSWDFAAPAGCTLELTLEPAQSPFPVAVTLSGGATSYSLEETVPAGYYTLSAQVKKDGSVVSGAVEGVLAIAGGTTTGSVALGGTVPDTPVDPPVYTPKFADMPGAIYTPDATTFRIWSPDSASVKVRLDGVEHSLALRGDFNGYTNVYEVIVPGDWKNKEYSFIVNGVQVRDPYGRMAKPNENVNIVMALADIAPAGGWADRPALDAREDAIVYEVHVRDFTIDSSWNGTAANRGKFPGMVETGTTSGGFKTGIDHLKELGVTHVQILPFYDFGSSAQYNWGYNPVNWNVPEEQYSVAYAQSLADYEGRVREVQEMVNEFHRNGIRVVMDVVYNHTYADEMFSGITGKYFTGTNDSGCGNAINSGVPMVSRTIRDSLEYWVDLYNIDGFRFDLIGIFHYDEVRQWGEYLNKTKFPDRNLLVYGEPWNGYWGDPNEGAKVRYGTTRFLSSGHVGVFNGAYREAIKGSNDNRVTAFMFNNVANADNGWKIYDGFRGSPYSSSDPNSQGTWARNFAADPEQSVNYISAHDNFCLWDKVYLSLAAGASQSSNNQVTSISPPANMEYAKRVDRFGMGIVLVSQGIPFIHGGDEMLRTKTNNADMTSAGAWNFGPNDGAHNSYNAPDGYNSIKWGWVAANASTYDYYCDLVALRRAHAGLRMRTNAEIAQYLAVARPDTYSGQVVTGTITCPSDTDDLFVVINSGSNQSVSLPAGTWTRVFDQTGAVSVTGLSGSATCEGTAVTVFSKAR